MAPFSDLIGEFDSGAPSGPLLASASTARGWDFLGATPVPVRALAFQGFARALAAHPRAAELRACFPMGQGGYSPLDEVRKLAANDWPGLVVSADDDLLCECATRRALRRAYRAVQPAVAAAPFVSAGLLDPTGQVGVLAVAPFVWLVDLRRLGSSPMPRSFADLLDRRYEAQIVLGGWRRAGKGPFLHYNLYLLRALHARFGDDGLRAFSRNVSGFLHSAQMPRVAGLPGSVGAIYVLPWALAELCPRRDATAVVWPVDGALAYPLWAAVKRDRPDLAPLVDYASGPSLGAILDRNRYPSLRSVDAPALPPGGSLWWPGWEWVRDPLSAVRRERTKHIFFADRPELSAEGVRAVASAGATGTASSIAGPGARDRGRGRAGEATAWA